MGIELKNLVCLWIGPALGAVERACLRSALRHGHQVTLYSYGTPDGVPEGVQLADAAEVLPASAIIAYANGSFSLFSNHFRYRAQQLGLGTWIDCDAYFLAPLDLGRPYLIGEYEPGKFSTGVLRIPSESPLLPFLLAPFSGTMIPDWMPLRAKVAAYGRLLMTGRSPLSQMPWGTTGPLALTRAVRHLGVDVQPLSPDVLYPVRWEEAEWIIDPAQRLEDRITRETVSIHLWNERIKHLKTRAAPAGTFLARIQAEGA